MRKKLCWLLEPSGVDMCHGVDLWVVLAALPDTAGATSSQL